MIIDDTTPEDFPKETFWIIEKNFKGNYFPVEMPKELEDEIIQKKFSTIEEAKAEILLLISNDNKDRYSR